MALGVATNIPSLSAQRSLVESSRAMEQAMERLSSGKRINSAGDDASGLATASRMEAQIRGVNQAVRNANDGQAMVQTIESGLAEVGDILQRLRELAVQSATDTASSSDRTYINDEKTALLAEINRIASKTSFNGIRVLDGTLASNLHVGAEANDTISVSQADVSTATLGGFINQQGTLSPQAASNQAVASRTSTAETITISGHAGSATTAAPAAGDSAKEITKDINAKSAETGVFATARSAYKIFASANNQALTFTIQTSDTSSASDTSAAATVSVSDGQDLAALTKAINAVSATTGVTASKVSDGVIILDEDGSDIIIARSDTTAGDIAVKALASDLSTTQGTVITFTQANKHLRLEGMIDLHSSKTFEITQSGTASKAYLASAAVTSTALSTLDFTTKAKANTAITLLDGAIETLASHRSNLGAIDNRLTHTVDNLMNVSEATSAAKSRIEDADFAVESAQLAKSQVLMQAGTSMLAQANASSQLVLQLLQ